MNLGAILTTCLIGLVVGIVAKLLMPGRDPGGCIITILLGIAGAWLGTFLGRATFGGSNYAAGWIMSIVGAMILLLIYRMIFGKRS
ncbi:MAG: GlsB/YeaQ/YmgE family stress response membrane protein, partial [Chthoniobacterales bacterium]